MSATEISTAVAAIKADVAPVISTATADYEKFVAELGYVRAHWSMISIVVVGAAIAGFVLGKLI